MEVSLKTFDYLAEKRGFPSMQSALCLGSTLSTFNLLMRETNKPENKHIGVFPKLKLTRI